MTFVPLFNAQINIIFEEEEKNVTGTLLGGILIHFPNHLCHNTKKIILTIEKLMEIKRNILLYKVSKWVCHEKNLYVTGTLFKEFLSF